ncbi:LLM class flavin-dependent oxidoreductase [Paenibacillus sp. GCM10012307]|uniref:LLM class flavin-dependent oxidoreductase n=1 Tax=Paenibacillus roseus TaxID=2798579 RepID=A0A934J4A2_9BACL|nr:LLM class flavin-dependent oxidoreductase [Paenibacillus roseus]MBJ6360073.1 LLM class flavin-dependent oxidoreductase [Paenibacillus roseus]
MSIRLSALDRSPVNKGENPTDGILNTVKLAQKAEELGFHRFWVSEHHGSDALAGSSPEILISYLVSQTNHIRIGSGGVMLQHYSPYKVAENFNLLSILAPGRIDLGVGRGPGGLPRSTHALTPAVNGEPISLEDKIDNLNRYLQPDGVEGLRAQPVPTSPPELYVLGTGQSSAELTAAQGLPYVYAHFINGDEPLLKESLSTYRTKFNATKGEVPELILAIYVLYADTDEEAERLAAEQVTYQVHLQSSGKTLSIQSLEHAERIGQQANEPYTISSKPTSIIYGTRETVVRKILNISEAHNIEEIMILPAVHKLEQRLQTYEWLSADIKQYQEAEKV